MRTEGRKKSTQIGQEKTVTPATAPRDTCLVAGVMHGGSVVGSSWCPLSPGDNIQAAQASRARRGAGAPELCPPGLGVHRGAGGLQW